MAILLIHELSLSPAASVTVSALVIRMKPAVVLVTCPCTRPTTQLFRYLQLLPLVAHRPVLLPRRVLALVQPRQPLASAALPQTVLSTPQDLKATPSSADLIVKDPTFMLCKHPALALVSTSALLFLAATMSRTLATTVTSRTRSMLQATTLLCLAPSWLAVFLLHLRSTPMALQVELARVVAGRPTTILVLSMNLPPHLDLDLARVLLLPTP